MGRINHALAKKYANQIKKLQNFENHNKTTNFCFYVFFIYILFVGF